MNFLLRVSQLFGKKVGEIIGEPLTKNYNDYIISTIDENNGVINYTQIIPTDDYLKALIQNLQ